MFTKWQSFCSDCLKSIENMCVTLYRHQTSLPRRTVDIILPNNTDSQQSEIIRVSWFQLKLPYKSATIFDVLVLKPNRFRVISIQYPSPLLWISNYPGSIGSAFEIDLVRSTLSDVIIFQCHRLCVWSDCYPGIHAAWYERQEYAKTTCNNRFGVL